jgi:hypothetical protein
MLRIDPTAQFYEPSPYDLPLSVEQSSAASRSHFSRAYSALASFRTGMPGSASFQSVRKSL